MKTRHPVLKAVFLFIIAALLFAAAAIFFYRQHIIQYSAEKFIRGALPEYITIDAIKFEFDPDRVVLDGFRIKNPPGFSNKYLAEISRVECGYRIKGKSLFDGIAVSNPVIRKPVLIFERLSSGRMNINEMSQLMRSNRPGLAASLPEKSGVSRGTSSGGNMAREYMLKDRKISDIIALPDTFIVQDGKAVFIDSYAGHGSYMVTLENVEASLSILLDENYTKVLKVASSGTGNINGRRDETIRWDSKLDPVISNLTMSNKLEISGADIRTFEPYYDKYSPFKFEKGRFSGILIFDFDNGNIGSSNEVRLSNLSFSIKRGFENAMVLQTAVPDLVKYFRSSSGDIIFDFKIKGPMSDPQFYLGPISKQAIAAMAIDKIGQALAQAAAASQKEDAASSGEKSDLEKAAEYIKMFQGMIGDKKD